MIPAGGRRAAGVLRRAWAAAIVGLWLALLVTACQPLFDLDPVVYRPSATASQSPAPTAVPTTPPATPAPQPTAVPTVAAPATSAPRSSPAAGPGGVRLPALPTAVPTLAAATAHAQFYDLSGDHLRQISVLVSRFEEVYQYVTARLAAAPRRMVNVGLTNPIDSPCTARGVAYGEQSPERLQVVVLIDEGASDDQLLAVVGHELAHIVQRDFAGGLIFDPILGEGGANWASEQYWWRWQGWPSFDAAVRFFLQTDRFVPITQSPRDCTIANRDISYTEWASFVGYLVDRYGLDRYKAASRAAQPRTRGAPVRPGGFYPDDERPWYAEAFGRTIEDLEKDWLARVVASS